MWSMTNSSEKSYKKKKKNPVTDMVMVIEKDGLKVFGVKTFFSFFKFVFYADTPPYIITRCRYTKYDLSEK